MKRTFASIVVLIFCLQLSAQKYFTRTGHITFESKTDIEDIVAENRSSVSIINLEDGRVEFSVLIKGFVFEKALMQEHFNENYMESSKYPKAVFKGYIDDYAKGDFSASGEFTVTVSGKLTLHNVENDINATVKITNLDGTYTGQSQFKVRRLWYEC